jgi:hypothetical protein
MQSYAYMQWVEDIVAPVYSKKPQRCGNVFLLLSHGQRASLRGYNISRMPRRLSKLFTLTSTITQLLYIHLFLLCNSFIHCNSCNGLNHKQWRLIYVISPIIFPLSYYLLALMTIFWEPGPAENSKGNDMALSGLHRLVSSLYNFGLENYSE